jgi:guanylate kinase
LQPGKLIVITAPSGAGKTTIARHLLASIPELSFSVSATTRPQRHDEVDGRDYHFITPEAFKRWIEEGAFVEWEEVYHGLFYGTLRREMEKIWQKGNVALFDVDVNGAMRLKKKFPANTLTIFIKPPSYDVLTKRLHNRATEPADKIEERINKAKKELQFESSFDAVIVNDYLEHALSEVENVVQKFIRENR